jgi:pantoate--beta-alanine ligase
MKTVTTAAELREALAGAPRPVALVPTMGALHAGHEALIAAARGAAGTVVVSLFVNPAQFDDGADLAAYPRDAARDAAVAAAAGVDLLFAPGVEDIYPDGFATTISVGGLAERLEGAQRGAGHFAGVATVVTKLLNLVRPDQAYFGQKDAQQLAVVRRLVADLDLGVEIVGVPTVREVDGLAISSRNVHLRGEDRARATALYAALLAAQAGAQAGERDPEALRETALAALRREHVEPEYVALVDPDTFAPLPALNGRALVAIAARVGAVRLIDNLTINTEVH